MPGNRSLDEFVAEADESGAAPEPDSATDTDPDGEATPSDEVTTAVVSGDEADPVEPMAETYAWTAEGQPCETCGEPAAVRWRDGEALVCEDCKAW